jgi:hypothetical protein
LSTKFHGLGEAFRARISFADLNESSLFFHGHFESLGLLFFSKKIVQDSQQSRHTNAPPIKVKRSLATNAVPLPAAGWVDAPALLLKMIGADSDLT